jgi:hypothetical protein
LAGVVAMVWLLVVSTSIEGDANRSNPVARTTRVAAPGERTPSVRGHPPER